jgi:hypothetical protein
MTTYTEAELFAAVQAGYHAPDDLPLATRSWLEGYRAGRSTPQPVVDVNQQLLNDIINMLVAVKGAIKLGRDADACNYINAAIAAAQDSYTYSPDGKIRINKNGNFGF